METPMGFPMRITVKRLVETGCRSEEELADRLGFWAARYGFRRAPDGIGCFVYERGSHWHAIYTFDIRKVPTEVRVTLLDDGAGICRCTISCGSWLQISTPGDEDRLSQEMDLLEACIGGALADPYSVGVEKGFSRRRNRGSQDIQEGDATW